jgi:ABC-type polysaccharide/polyol phosphate export permease
VNSTAEPSATTLTPASRELNRWIELLTMIAWRTIKVRYKQSFMGALWALFMPLVVVAAGLMVRVFAARLGAAPIAPGDVARLAVKAIAWGFFVGTLRFGTNSLGANVALVTKIAFPKIIFPLSSVAAGLVDFAVAAILPIGLLIIAQTPVTVELLWIPILLLLLVALTAGLCILLSAANLFYRDVKYLVEVVLTFAIFFTPVLFDASMLGPWASRIMLNPVAPILEGLADVAVAGRAPDLGWLGYSAAVSVVILAVSILVFRRAEPLFAERA